MFSEISAGGTAPPAVSVSASSDETVTSSVSASSEQAVSSSVNASSDETESASFARPPDRSASAPLAAVGRRLGRTGVVLLLTACMALAGYLWLHVLVPNTFLAPIPCPFEAVTGYDCPGCGLQSSLTNLFELRWKYVFMANLLSPLLLPLFYLAVVAWLGERLFGVTVWKFNPPPWSIAVGVIIVIVYGVLRNIPALGIW